MFNNSRPKWQIVKYARGTKIAPDCNNLWLIKRGTVKVFTYDLEGSTIILGYWGERDIVGQIITNFDPYEIECLTPVELAIVPYQDWHYIAKEIRNCFQDLERLIYIHCQKNVVEKLLDLLIYLSDKFGIVCERGQEISISLTDRDLSQILNITRVSVTRSLNLLQSKKYIEIPKRGKIILRTTEIPRRNYKF